MKKNKLFILAFILFSLPCFAQVPGYQGLRFSVKYDLGLMHPIFEGRRGPLPWVYHNLAFDYVITRNLSVGIQYGFMITSQQPNHLAIGSSAIDENYNTYLPADHPMKYTQHTVAFKLKKFFRKKGYIAPVGRYLVFGAYYQYAIDNSVSTVSTDYSYSGYSNGLAREFKATCNMGGVVLGIGRTFVVANRVLIDFGCDFNLPVVVFPSASVQQTIAYRDVVFNNMFHVYLGLGVLAF